MRCLICILIISLAIEGFSQTNTRYNVTSDRYTLELAELIKADNAEAIEAYCNDISKMDSTERNHDAEVEVLHTAIDHLNPETLSILYKHGIGLYNPRTDSIKPIDYFFKGDFNQRLAAIDAKTINPNDLVQRLYWLMKILTAYQPLDDAILYDVDSNITKIFDEVKIFYEQ